MQYMEPCLMLNSAAIVSMQNTPHMNIKTCGSKLVMS